VIQCTFSWSLLTIDDFEYCKGREISLQPNGPIASELQRVCGVMNRLAARISQEHQLQNLLRLENRLRIFVTLAQALGPLEMKNTPTCNNFSDSPICQGPDCICFI